MDQNKLNKAIAFHRAQDFHSAKKIYEEVIRNKSIDKSYESLASLFENDLKKYKWSHYSF
tara:strand:+ start:1153 stop:1332 length:180 start_codon:yes stop_codon:yes gene_type:complete